MSKRVIVFGNTVLSKMLYYDSLGDPEFEIACFTVDQAFLNDSSFMGLPLIDSEDVIHQYPPDQYDMIAVLGGYSCMRNRKVHFEKALSMGYIMRNYISKKADVLPEVAMGVNNIIMGQAHIGMGGRMGNNNMIRQNVYLGHDFLLGDHNTVAAGSTIGGSCVIQDTCYIGLGATIINNTTVAEESLVGAGAVVIRNTEPFSKNVGNPSRVIGYHKEQGIQMKVDHG